MRRLLFICLFSFGFTANAQTQDPDWFNRDEFSFTNLDLYRYYRSMLQVFRCDDPRMPYQKICKYTSDTHNDIVNIGECLDRHCPFRDLKNVTFFYLRLGYPEYRAVYAEKPRTQEADDLLHLITQKSLVLQDLILGEGFKP